MAGEACGTKHLKPTNRAGLEGLLLIASNIYVIGFYFIGSAIKPGYSQISDFVGEYNATGTLRFAWHITRVA